MDWLGAVPGAAMITVAAVLLPRLRPAGPAAAQNPRGARAYRTMMLGSLSGGLGILGMSVGRHLVPLGPPLVALAVVAFVLVVLGAVLATWGAAQLIRVQARTGWAFEPFSRSH